MELVIFNMNQTLADFISVHQQTWISISGSVSMALMPGLEEENALAIAVDTGPHSPEELAFHHPDFLFQNLKDNHRVLAAIG